MAEPFLGEIRMFALDFTPRGWAPCNGQLLQINANQALFSLLGTTYGGDGRITFGLPDFRGRAPMGRGAGPGLSAREPGERLGSESETLRVNQMPAHSHGLRAVVAPATEVSPIGHRYAEPEDEAFGAPGIAMAQSGPTGSGVPHDNQPPSLVVRFMIATQGIFPARN